MALPACGRPDFGFCFGCGQSGRECPTVLQFQQNGFRCLLLESASPFLAGWLFCLLKWFGLTALLLPNIASDCSSF